MSKRIDLSNEEDFGKKMFDLGYNKAIEEIEKMILKHKDCKNYNRIDFPKKKVYILSSCLNLVLDDLNKLKGGKNG